MHPQVKKAISAGAKSAIITICGVVLAVLTVPGVQAALLAHPWGALVIPATTALIRIIESIVSSG